LLNTYFISHGGEANFESPGVVYFSTTGLPSNVADIGSLEVHYNIELFLPKTNAVSMLTNSSRISAPNADGVTCLQLYNGEVTGQLTTTSNVCTMQAGPAGSHTYEWYFPVSGLYCFTYQVSVLSSSSTLTCTTALGAAATLATTGIATASNYDDAAINSGSGFLKLTGQRWFYVNVAAQKWNQDIPVPGAPPLYVTFASNSTPTIKAYWSWCVSSTAAADVSPYRLVSATHKPMVKTETQTLREEIEELKRAFHSKDETEEWDLAPPPLQRTITVPPVLDIEDTCTSKDPNRYGPTSASSSSSSSSRVSSRK